MREPSSGSRIRTGGTGIYFSAGSTWQAFEPS